MVTPKKASRKSKEDGECDTDQDQESSPLKKLDRAKYLDAKKIKDSLKKSKRPARPARLERSDSSDEGDSADSDSEGDNVEGTFLQSLNGRG